MELQPRGDDEQDGQGRDEPPRPVPLFGLALGFYGFLFTAAALWAALAHRPLAFATPEDALRGVRPLRDVSLGLLAAGLAIAASHAFTRWTSWGERLARTLGELLGRRSWGECAALAALSGVAEEAFFRGALQPHVGLVAASLLFGLAHFAPRRELLPWTVFSVAAGLLLGTLFVMTGNLLAPIVAHAGLNAVNLRWLGRHYG